MTRKCPSLQKAVKESYSNKHDASKSPSVTVENRWRQTTEAISQKFCSASNASLIKMAPSSPLKSRETSIKMT